MLRRIVLKGYKSFPEHDLHLEPFCVLFGPNAAGKSNFLDAIQLIGRLARCSTLKDAFAPPYRGTALESFTFPPNGIKGLLEQHSARMSFEVDVELSDAVVRKIDQLVRDMKSTRIAAESSEPYGGKTESQYVKERFLRYRIEIEVLPKSGILRVVDEYLAALNAKGEPRSSRHPFLEKVGGKLHLRMEGRAHPRYHDVHLDRSVLSMPHYAPHCPHLAAMQEQLSRWCIFYFEPRERMRMTNPVRDVSHIGLMGEELAAFLNTLRSVDERQLRGVEKAIHAIVPSITGLDINVNDLGEVELRIREGNATIPARVVSEGTLRILGLLALGATKQPLPLIGFEEPENGVHPRRVRLIAELLRNRAEEGATQIIVTTHSRILPDLIPDKHLYVCRRVKGKSEITPLSTWRPCARTDINQDARDAKQSADKGTLLTSQRIMRGDFDA